LQSLLGQRLGVELSDDAFATIETLGQLRRLTETAVSAGTPLSAETPLQPQTHSPESAGHVYPRWPWAWPILALRIVFLEAVLRPLIWLLAAPRVVHASASVPSAPLLLIANHVTAYDGALVLYALPTKLRRRVAIAMSGEMLLDFRKGRNQGNPVRNALAPLAYLFMTALFNVFPLPRRSGFRGSFAHAGAAMDMGYSVLIFPEGHRSSDGTLQSFRPGIGILAKESNVAILPVALKGLGEMKRSGWFRSGKLEIRVGSAVPVGDGADASEIARTLEAAMRALQATGLQALQVTSQRP
jgi:long-chain acyl-CoA synthetase